ncbi:MAG: 30S ribosomal protein S6e [Candidatus Lokiarchaeota archaeon]|nr:30S ribosomal protein S6e [Candidatus Lokiarchaeota archaeon]
MSSSKSKYKVNVIISDPKIGRSIQIRIDDKKFRHLLGYKIGEEISGEILGYEQQYKFKITGGSDTDGCPMRRDISGSGRKKVLIKKGVGHRPKRNGQRARKMIRGNTINEDIAQINLKIIEYGSKPIIESPII